MGELLAILTGGATGLLGMVVRAGIDWVQARQKHAQEIELRGLDIQLAQIEGQAAATVATIERESERDSQEWQALRASFRAAATRWSSGDSKWLVLVDVVRGLMRPALTLAFVALTSVIYFVSSDSALEARVVETVLYQTSACTLWWFGSRPQRRAAAP